MDNSTTYAWQGAYQCAVLETNPAQMASRIDDALRAIEKRLGTTVRIDQAENDAIEVARNALAVLRGEWFGGLSESMDGVPQKTSSRLSLFRNSQGKTELLGRFSDVHSAKRRLTEHLAVSPGYYAIYDERTGERLLAESAPEGH